MPCILIWLQSQILSIQYFCVSLIKYMYMHFLTHFLFCVSEFGHYAGRVRFESNSPMENSALLIPITEVSDEGRYTCRISTFPKGNFERSITLIVWSMSFPPLLAFSFFPLQPPTSSYKSFWNYIYTKKSSMEGSAVFVNVATSIYCQAFSVWKVSIHKVKRKSRLKM